MQANLQICIENGENFSYWSEKAKSTKTKLLITVSATRVSSHTGESWMIDCANISVVVGGCAWSGDRW